MWVVSTNSCCSKLRLQRIAGGFGSIVYFMLLFSPGWISIMHFFASLINIGTRMNSSRHMAEMCIRFEHMHCTHTHVGIYSWNSSCQCLISATKPLLRIFCLAIRFRTLAEIYHSITIKPTAVAATTRGIHFWCFSKKKNHFTCAIRNVTFRLLWFFLTLRTHSPDWLVGKGIELFCICDFPNAVAFEPIAFLYHLNFTLLLRFFFHSD